jgi:vacuole morphology and inheritance protein 14
MFIPLLQNYIRRTNPFIRQLLVGWITVLDSVPDINMIDWLPDFLDGLFNMLSDSNREIRQAADSALTDFLREVKESSVVEYGPMVAILVTQCNSKERLNRLIAITWISEFIHLGGDALLPFHSEILGACMRTISDDEVEIRQVAEVTNNDLLTVVKETANPFDLSPLLTTLTGELLSTDVATKMAALRWINMLLEKKNQEMNQYIADILPVLLKTLSDPSDPVVLLNLQVLSRISLHTTEFQLVMTAVLNLFASDRALLEARGSLIIRKFCVLLNAKSVYICMAGLLLSTPSNSSSTSKDTISSTTTTFSFEFISIMVQTLNLILLTAPELHELRSILKISFSSTEATEADRSVFVSLFNTWCHNPVATFSLCLMAQAYDVSYALISKFALELELTVGILMQVDKLVQLLESPVFVHLRLQLLDVEAPYHAPLLKACYGLLMLLPQGDAFRTLNERLATICNLRDNLSGIVHIVDRDDVWDTNSGGVLQKLQGDGTSPAAHEIKRIDSARLLATFDKVMEMHKRVKPDDAKFHQLSSPSRRQAASMASSTLGRYTDPEEVRSAREGKV